MTSNSNDEIEQERITADRRWFDVSPSQLEAFTTLIDTPLPSTAKMQRLADRKSPFAKS